MSSLVTTDLVDALVGYARAAGHAILEIYEREDLGVTTKADESPLTEADLASHRILMAGLRSVSAELPILSEESEMPPYDERRQWEACASVTKHGVPG